MSIAMGTRCHINLRIQNYKCADLVLLNQNAQSYPSAAGLQGVVSCESVTLLQHCIFFKSTFPLDGAA